MGGKASAEVVRHGADRAVVSCVFEATAAADAILEENGIDSTGTEIILRREILVNGKGRVFVNNQPATVTVLRLLAPELALVHAQSETLSSFDQAQQRILLDRFASMENYQVIDAYHHWQTASRKLAELEQGEQDRLRMVDLWTYQRKEIEQAQLLPGEDQDLENEKRVLANAEKLYAAALGAFDQLYEGANSAESSLRAALRNLEELARYDGKFTDAVQQLTSARAIVDDLSDTLRDYAQDIQASPERLVEIEDRLVIIDRLKRKYGHTIAEVIAFGEDVAAKLAEIHSFIVSLPKGYDTYIGGMSTSLSSGQGQRIGLARALLRDAPVLILDEATSNLDLTLEARIMINVLSARKRKSTIIISHRPSVAALASRRFVLNKHVLEEDTAVVAV